MASPVTEKWLGEIGGWQAMKSARELVRLGAVSEVTQDGPTYRGVVGSGPQKFRATLTVGQGSHAEAKCACSDDRRGLICPHALAVALATISLPGATPSSIGTSPPKASPGTPSQPSSSSAGAGQGRAVSPPSTTIPAGEFTVHIATDALKPLPGRSQATIPVFLKFQPGGFSPDLTLSLWLLQHSLPIQTMPLRLPLEDFSTLLDALVEHPRVHDGLPDNRQKSTLPTEKTSSIIHIAKLLRLPIFSKLVNGAKDIQIETVNAEYLPVCVRNSPWFWAARDRAFAAAPQDLPGQVLAFLAGLIQSGQAIKPIRWFAENQSALYQVIRPVSADDALGQLRILPAQPIFQLRLEGNLRRVEARLSFLLQGDLPSAAQEALYPIQDPQNPLLFYSRNSSAEEHAFHLIEIAGFQSITYASREILGKSESASAASAFEIKGERAVLRFLASDLSRLRREFQIVEGDGWRHATRGLTVVRPKVHPPSTRGTSSLPVGPPGSLPGASPDWLSLEVAYEAADGFSIPRSEVLRLIRSGKRDTIGRDGRRYLLDADGCEELEEMVQDMESHFESGNRLVVRARQAEVLGSYVDRPEVLSVHLVPALDPATLKARLGRLGDILRPYQFEGVRWLERHSRTHGGGILADEMGLGKTLQTLAVLRLLNQFSSSDSSPTRAPALVICPTSLLSNWSEEAARFTPELRTHISHDSDRHEFLERLSDFDVIFTSYALIVRDLEFYKPVTFSTVVLDEASYIRNPDTATAKAVRQLRAGSRFALTGTPVENSVRDLWSIFEFLVPGQLPSRDDFQERFVKPLGERGSDLLSPSFSRAALDRLRRLIRPNILRRTKREVAKDLPEKIEKVLWCDLSAPQREVYQRLLDEGREEIRQARRRAGQGSARMTMFTVLLRLRQVCNDLRLVGIQGIGNLSPVETSGKWSVLEELLQETLDGGHKALIFSQFVSMLRLVKAKVEADGTSHSYLDGATQDRASQVTQFQTDPDRRLFLISLKAGGYGLNLTAADEVILIDPWWNPAVEAQAIDRAHRIGQGRPVTAYRLITRGTVEEKILKLQSQKRAVTDMTLEEDGVVLAGVTDTELEAMLE